MGQFIDLKDPRNEKIVNELNNLNTNIKDIEIVDRFKVFAVLQKFGIKNANGRIYPEQVLKRQVDEYLSKIRDNSSFGELKYFSEDNFS